MWLFIEMNILTVIKSILCPLSKASVCGGSLAASYVNLNAKCVFLAGHLSYSEVAQGWLSTHSFQLLD